MWMECFAGDSRIEGETLDEVADRFVTHAGESHDWPYPEEALRNYARNYAEANVRLSDATERRSEIGEVAIHPVDEERLDDWIVFFDRDAFAGNPGWASCYCLEPHLPAGESLERPWREIRSEMVDRLRNRAAFGYLAYVGGKAVGWVNASTRSDYGLYRLVDPGGPDPSSVIGVSCFIIAPPYRGHGMASRLLDRVIADAADRGARWVEAYPYKEPEAGDPGHFRGPKSIYDARGFVPVEERDRDIVMRRPA